MLFKIEIETSGGLEFLIEMYPAHCDIFEVFGFGGARLVHTATDLIAAYFWLENHVKPDKITKWQQTHVP